MGLVARLGTLFRGASAQELKDLANVVVAQETPVDLTIMKNGIAASLKAQAEGLVGKLHGIPTPADQFNGGTAGMDCTAVEGPGGDGPQERASGGGASRMVSQYSDYAQQ